VSFSIAEGEVFGFLGPNGAGKSTTIRHIMGFMKPDQGFATVNGLNTWKEQGKAQRFIKLTGSQRPVGLIYPADAVRQVFLGTVVLGDETRGYQYGHDHDRDLAAWVERIDDNRWRMIFPYPHFESTLDVIELVPEQ